MEVVQGLLDRCVDVFESVVQGLPVPEDSTKTIIVRCASGAAGIYILSRLYRSHKKAQLRKQWDSVGKDVVVLHQPQRGRFTPSISPYPIKLETYLRMAKIPYQNDFEEPMGPKGKLPWITLNGVDTGDSQLCIELLSRHFNKDLNSSLSDEQKATARALRILVEDHLYWVKLQRWVCAKGRGLEQFQAGLSWSFFLFLPLTSRKLKASAIGHGMGRHTEAEVIEMGLKDLKALSAFLGSKQFFMGQKATEVDCAIFGPLAITLWSTKTDDIFFQHLNGELSNLKDYCIRMKEMYWPDWDRCLYNPQ